MRLDVDSPVVIIAALLVFVAEAVIAWRLGTQLRWWLVAVLWIPTGYVLAIRFVGILAPIGWALQPVLIPMVAAAVGGIVGRHPSRWRVVSIALALWAVSVVIGCVFLPPRFPESLWSGPRFVLTVIFDPHWVLYFFK